VSRKSEQPHQIGRYEIRSELGRGVMGVVYQAWDTVLGRTIALKTIKPVADSAEQREAWERRFLVEAQAAARLSHPAIVVVYDVGRDPDTDVLYIALEYLEGQSLARKAGPGRPLPWRDALRIVGQVAEGLHHAHAQGVIHRDIKPANVMVLPSGDAKILDFGVARVDEGSLTNPGDLCGTPLYMSPEQASGHVLDARSDIFSLGAVAWTLLTGQSPFDAPTVSAILMRVMHKSPPPPSEIVRGIPKDVDEILARALAKMPEDRYPDARQLAEDLEDALADRVPRHRGEWTPIAAGERTRISPGGQDARPALAPPDGAPPARARSRRRRGWLSIALLMGLAAAAFLHFRSHPEDLSLLEALLRQAARSRPVQVAHDWLRPPQSTTSPAAAAAKAWPGAVPEQSTPTPDALVALPAGQTTDLAGQAGARAVVGEDPDEETAPATGEAALQPDSAPIGTSGPAPGPGAKPETSQSPSVPTTPQPSPTAGASGAASAPAARPVPSPPPKKTRAYLSIGFEHRLKSGALEVWVDGRRVVQEPLDSRATRKVLVLEVRKGNVEQTLPLVPGRHAVKVRIRSGGETKTARTTSLFRAGATRRLEISLSRLSGKISLEWR
jgi:hypothetical protein